MNALKTLHWETKSWVILTIGPIYVLARNPQSEVPPRYHNTLKIYLSVCQTRVNHLDLWDVKRKPPPRANAPPPEAFIIFDDSPAPCVDDYLTDPDRSTLRLSTGYPAEAYL